MDCTYLCTCNDCGNVGLEDENETETESEADDEDEECIL